ncbi:hypothetical protein SESBI_27277 [Sesbania bispinosa]|nr:hypothetical protein SESBI_27277 [Sesbania bispinosa]
MPCLLAPISTYVVSSSDSFLANKDFTPLTIMQSRKNNTCRDLIFMAEKGNNLVSSSTRMGWKPTPNPFNLGSFGLISFLFMQSPQRLGRTPSITTVLRFSLSYPLFPKF